MKEFEAPVIEVIEFAAEDVMDESTSNDMDTGADENYGGAGKED